MSSSLLRKQFRGDCHLKEQTSKIHSVKRQGRVTKHKHTKATFINTSARLCLATIEAPFPRDVPEIEGAYNVAGSTAWGKGTSTAVGNMLKERHLERKNNEAHVILQTSQDWSFSQRTAAGTLGSQSWRASLATSQ